jgi:hypothetical protein
MLIHLNEPEKTFFQYKFSIKLLILEETPSIGFF